MTLFEQPATAEQQKDQLFIIDPKLFGALNNKEIEKTCSALKELGLYKLPYQKTLLRVPAQVLMSAPCLPWIYVDVILEEGAAVKATMIDPKNSFKPIEFFTPSSKVDDLVGSTDKLIDRKQFRKEMFDLLITLLATKNTVKSTKHSKRVRLGIGARTHEYTTTISMPKDIDIEIDSQHIPLPGAPVRPHLRRGHIRSQHYGPRYTYLRRIWIAPVIVNADESFVNKRRAYNMSFKL